MPIRRMIKAHPVMPQFQHEDLVSFLGTVLECGQTCLFCADACLAEEGRDLLVRCIRINQDCADICFVTERLVTRFSAPDTKLIQSQLQTLVMACLNCRDECARHAERHEHCRVCAEVCARCEEVSTRLLSFFPATVAQDSR